MHTSSASVSRDEIQPRLGVSYQVRDGKGDKAYANWGRYYNMDQKSSGRSLAPSRIFQTQTVFDLSGNVLSSGPLASTTGKMIDPAIKPIYTDEILVGYATPIAGAYSLDVFFMSRGMHNFIEDVPSRLNGTAPDSGPFVAANLPCVAFAACQAADARRTYRAVTIDVRRRLASGWMSDVSYTWSRFEGNFDLDYCLWAGLQHLVVHPGRLRARTSRIRTVLVRCSKIGRTSSRCSPRTRRPAG